MTHSSNCMTMGDSLTKPAGRIEADSLFALEAHVRKRDTSSTEPLMAQFSDRMIDYNHSNMCFKGSQLDAWRPTHYLH